MVKDLDKNIKFKDFINTLCKEMSPIAILCYGSYAHGMQDEKSDIDLLIFVEKLPSKSARKRIYKKISAIKILELGNDKNLWESAWTLRNDRLDLDGVKIEPGFNKLNWLKRVISSLLKKNDPAPNSMPFRPYTILGLIEASIVLYEKNFCITNLRKQIRPFPKKLKKAIIAQNYPLFCENYNDLLMNSDRNIGFLAYQFQIGMFFDTVLQLLFVINDVYDPASKRVEAFLAQYKFLPEGFIEFIEQVLPKCYHDRTPLIKYAKKIKVFIEKKLNEQNLNPTTQRSYTYTI